MVTLTATLDATTLLPGDYEARVEIGCNDPLRPVVAVPVSLHVIGVPNIVVPPAGLEFGEVFRTSNGGIPVRLVMAGLPA